MTLNKIPNFPVKAFSFSEDKAMLATQSGITFTWDMARIRNALPNMNVLKMKHIIKISINECGNKEVKALPI